MELCKHGSAFAQRVADTLSNSRGGSLWNPVGFGLILSLRKDLSDCRLSSTPHWVGLREPQTCTTGRHLGSGEGGASVQLLHDSWLSEVVWQDLGGYQLCLKLKMFFSMLLFDIFMTDCSKGRGKIIFEHWQRGDNIVLSVSSLSFQFPSSMQWSHWFVLWGVCVAEAWPFWPHFLFLSSQC